jgi:hypothetical protein
MPPKRTRGEDKRKAEVTERAFLVWQSGEFGPPHERGVLSKKVAPQFLKEYIGISEHKSYPSEDYYQNNLKNFLRRIKRLRVNK